MFDLPLPYFNARPGCTMGPEASNVAASNNLILRTFSYILMLIVIASMNMGCWYVITPPRWHLDSEIYQRRVVCICMTSGLSAIRKVS
ncbi:hypothetical protein BDR05DRAFT_284344 [Suillus weaverae]|nr:hypothetical protein BDR05DRAFT_284344 [Suillus weaverae]